jgi:hypothetical protein
VKLCVYDIWMDGESERTIELAVRKN